MDLNSIHPDTHANAPTKSRALRGPTKVRWRDRASGVLSARAQRLPTVLTNGGLLVTGVLTSVMCSRALGPGGRGEYVTWQAWAATVGVFALCGLPQVMVLDKQTNGRHRLAELVPSLASTAMFAVVVLGALLLITRPGWIVALAVLLIVTTNQLASVAAAEAQHVGRMTVEFNGARLVPQLAAIVAMVALVTAKSSSPAAWLIVVGAAQAAAMVAWILGATARGTSRPGTTSRLTRESLRLGVGNWVTLAQYRLDLLAVAAIFPTREVAFYAVGVAAQGAVQAAGQASGMHWFARQGAKFHNRHDQLRSELAKTMAMGLAIAAPLAVTSFVWVRVFYGADFAHSVPVVIVLCGVGVIQSLDYLFSHECFMLGRGDQVALYRAPALLVLVAGFGLVKWAGLPISIAALLSGLGYGLSTAVFAVVSRQGARRNLSGGADNQGMEEKVPAIGA
jgi:hypothetical protein